LSYLQLSRVGESISKKRIVEIQWREIAAGIHMKEVTAKIPLKMEFITTAIGNPTLTIEPAINPRKM